MLSPGSSLSLVEMGRAGLEFAKQFEERQVLAHFEEELLRWPLKSLANSLNRRNRRRAVKRSSRPSSHSEDPTEFPTQNYES
jgi:hypothetical protein